MSKLFFDPKKYVYCQSDWAEDTTLSSDDIWGEEDGNWNLIYSIPHINIDGTYFDEGEIESYDITVLFNDISEVDGNIYYSESPLGSESHTYSIYNCSDFTIVPILRNLLIFHTAHDYMDGIVFKSEHEYIVASSSNAIIGDNLGVFDLIDGTNITSHEMHQDTQMFSEAVTMDRSVFVTVGSKQDDGTEWSAMMYLCTDHYLYNSDLTRFTDKTQLYSFYGYLHENIIKTYDNSFSIDTGYTLLRDDGLIASFDVGTAEFSLYKHKSISFDFTSSVNVRVEVTDCLDNLIFSNTNISFDETVYLSNSFDLLDKCYVKIYSPDLTSSEIGNYDIKFDLTLGPMLNSRYVVSSLTDYIRVIPVVSDQSVSANTPNDIFGYSGLTYELIDEYELGGLGIPDDNEMYLFGGMEAECEEDYYFGGLQ